LNENRLIIGAAGGIVPRRLAFGLQGKLTIRLFGQSTFSL
jgi:hypothetical protein